MTEEDKQTEKIIYLKYEIEGLEKDKEELNDIIDKKNAKMIELNKTIEQKDFEIMQIRQVYQEVIETLGKDSNEMRRRDIEHQMAIAKEKEEKTSVTSTPKNQTSLEDIRIRILEMRSEELISEMKKNFYYFD